MVNLHGLILADRTETGLNELVACRTSASLPFAGRYRLIDFALSSLQNAGVHDVGVIMQQDYQSLLDHIGSGKEWDMSRKRGGLRLLPPFGRQSAGKGDYVSVIDALLAVEGYIRDIKQDYIYLVRGSLAVNLDLGAVMHAHVKSGADVTAVCTPNTPEGTHHRFVTDENGRATQLLFRRSGPGPGYAALEAYIMSRDTLLDLLERCDSAMNRRFHRDGLGGLMEAGGTINVYMHEGYAVNIADVNGYYKASMDMLEAKNRRELFPEDRPRGRLHLLRRRRAGEKLPGGGRLLHRGRDRKLRHLPRRARWPWRGAEKLHHHAGHRHRPGRDAELHHLRQGRDGRRRRDAGGQPQAAAGCSQGEQNLSKTDRRTYDDRTDF